MKTWDDIERLIGNAPRSQTYRIPKDEDKGEYFETVEFRNREEFNLTTDDTEITTMMYNLIENAINEHVDKELYVRVYPEIVMRIDRTKKDAYFRIQFADKKKVVVVA